MSEIPTESLDLILLSHMQQTCLNPEHAKTTQKTSSHTKVSDRKIASVDFTFSVCKYAKRRTYSLMESGRDGTGIYVSISMQTVLHREYTKTLKRSPIMLAVRKKKNMS